MRERTKTLALGILFFLSLLLIVTKVNKDDLKVWTKKSSTLDFEREIQNILKPSEVVINFAATEGGQVKLLDYSNYWRDLRLDISKVLKEKAELKPVDTFEYEKISKLKSIQIKYPFAVDKLWIEKYFDINLPQNMEPVYEMIIPAVDEKGVYFFANNGQIYHYDTNRSISSDILKKVQRNVEMEKIPRYYTLEEVFGVESQTLIPMQVFEYDYSYLRSRPILNLNTEDGILHLAKKIFNQRYDFVNRIVETSGNNTFVYGLGEEVLRIKNQGDIEYLNEKVASKDLKKEEALSKALGFISNLGINLDRLEISDFETLKIKGKLAYRIDFDYRASGLVLKTKNSISVMEIIVLGDVVYDFKSYVREVEDDATANFFKENQQMLTPQEILNRKYNFLKTNVLKNLKGNALNSLLQKLDRVRLVYVVDESGIMIPTWEFIFDTQVYLFDAYSAEVLTDGLG